MHCGQCGCEELEEGFIPDLSGATRFAGVWVRGEPAGKDSLWEKLNTGPAGVSVKGRDVLALQAFRCTDCGHLQLFARTAPPAGLTLPG